jgi:hypothetical protein
MVIETFKNIFAFFCTVIIWCTEAFGSPGVNWLDHPVLTGKLE